MDVDEVSLPTYEMQSALSMTGGLTASLEKMGPLGTRLTMKELFPYSRCYLRWCTENNLTYPEEKPFEIRCHIDVEA
jgi:hypothetical protein